MTYRGINPRLNLDPGHHHDTAVARCPSCGRPVDTTVEHWTLTTGRRPRFDLLAVAHHDPEPDDCGPCFTALHGRWLDLTGRHGAGLRRRHPDGGYTTLLGNDLHCGTRLQMLTATGDWLDGHYEIDHTPQGRQPVLYVALGGFNQPDAALQIPDRALLRYARHRS